MADLRRSLADFRVMDGAAGSDASPNRIDLAREAPFVLGAARVRPAIGDVLLAGQRVRLQPRVMQVLVALARAGGEAISRDDLVTSCWGGTVVGEDAINRCIQRLRRLEREAPGAFTIETLPRIGYRLLAADSPDRPQASTPALSMSFSAKGSMLAGVSRTKPASGSAAAVGRFRRLAQFWALAGVLVLLAAAAGGVWIWRERVASAPASPRMAFSPFVALEPDGASRDFSVRLSDQVVGVLKDNVVGLSLVDQPAAGAAKETELRLTGTVSRDGADWRVRTSLEDAQRGVTLWAGEFERPPSKDSMLQLEVAGAAAEVVDDAIYALQEKAARRDPRVLALFLQGEAAFKNPALMNGGEPRRLLEEAVARAPDFVTARALLSTALVTEGRTGLLSDRKLLLQRARLEAETAIRSNPAAAGPAYDTLYQLARMQADDLAAAEDILIEASAKAPRFPYLYMRRCRFLTEVGLAREALPYCQRALALRPLSAPLGFRYAEALYAAGSPELATRAIEKTASIHPEHPGTRRLQFELAALSGPPNAASALLRQPSQPEICNCMPSTPEGIQAMELFLVARKSGTPLDADTALAALNAAVHHGQLHPRYLVFGAAALGTVDASFEALARIPGPSLQGDPGYLFEGPAAPLWRDPRIWPMAARAGYVKYWRTRGVWPDFCSDPTLPYDCRVEAARVAEAAPGRRAR